ncbi:ribose-5-phosphate isomerase RpiA [Virgibacillus byunsanensis]|uniref:Ribose-5-phosphate isomerase A n=1 Tax=Virgibacillus byunsanensis TaxID=570945 RepID=A0ABW3LIM8_9BACI
MNELDRNKKIIGEEAAKYIKNGMTVGLGSGSTVYWMLKKLGERVEEGLDVKGIPTSKKTERLAKEFHIPLLEFSDIQQIDLAIDGADEVDEHLNLLKGGGGSLVREKIVDAEAKQLIIIADESKLVLHLGTFYLPVEVVPFGWEVTASRIAKLGGSTTLRETNNHVFVSDNGNYILDCDFGQIKEPATLHEKLKLLVGVVETGLFVGMTTNVISTKNGKLIKLA